VRWSQRMDPLGALSAVERHPLQPPSPVAASADADADFFAGGAALAAPPLGAAPPAGGLALLRSLARQGAWRAVAERATEAYTAPHQPRDAALSCVAYRALALLKLRQSGAAADALRLAGDLDAAPNLGPDGRSVAPFALRWLEAALPAQLGAPDATLDALCALHARCVSDAACARDAAEAATATRRADMTVHALVSFHAAARDWRAALAWLDTAARAAPHDPAPLCAAGLLLLQVGDAAGAARATDAAEAACEASGAAPHARAGVARNRAMLRFAAKDYAGARALFDAALAERPWDGVAANNAAVAALYCADLPGAVAVLEAALAAHPLAALHEPLVLNLCSLYELASADAAAAKRRIAEWVTRAGPEDFDSTASTRLT
jgi:hypothetical protein